MLKNKTIFYSYTIVCVGVCVCIAYIYYECVCCVVYVRPHNTPNVNTIKKLSL